MIKAWDKNGKEVGLGEDDLIDEGAMAQFKMLLAVISQEAKEIVTKIKIESEGVIFTVEQK